MGSGPSTTEKLRGLPWALANSACNIVFCYLGILGSVFMLFLDEAGLDKRQIGFLLALFPFSGTIALVIGPLIERAGVKRTFLLFWTLRKLVMALLIATPWVMGRYGATGAFHYVTAIVAAFALCRAVAETAWYPWVQEYVPDSIRGRFTATSSVVSTVAGLLSMGVATLVLRGSGGLSRFTWLFVVAAVFGLVSAVVASKIPGGAPVPRMSARTLDLGSVFRPFADRRFRLYLFGLAVALLGVTPLIVYLPLFMKEVCGLSAGQVVMLDGSIMLAAALVSVPWGWAADRFGSRPIMLLGLVSLMVFGLGLALLPRDSGAALGGAVALVFIYGMCSTAWVIGSGRILYNSIIPAERRTAYTSVYYAWIGVFGGISPLASGWLIERTREAGLSWGGAEIHAYAPVIIMFLVSVPVATWIMSRIRVEGEVPATTFAAMLVRGSPIGAMHSLISYSFASDEKTRVSTVERLGQAKSPLNVEELVESLDDLSFNVRYETIISIARTRPHARLTEALIAVLDGDEPDLSIAAAWALGRIGDPRAIAPLRRQLTSGYPLLAARSGRALAQLGDRESEPLLLARLREELDDGVRIAYAAALGALRADSAVPELLAFLRDAVSPRVRRELLLALARIAGREKQLTRLWRRMHHDRATTLGQAIDAIERRIARAFPGRPDLKELAERASALLSADAIDDGLGRLGELLDHLPPSDLAPSAVEILCASRSQLAHCGADRIEYGLLVIAILSDLRSSRAV